MANNTFLTPGMAGILEQPMADDAAAQKYPCYRFHPTLPMICVESEAEENALPPGYRDKQYTEEEADAWTKAQAAPAGQPDEGDTHTRRSHR